MSKQLPKQVKRFKADRKVPKGYELYVGQITVFGIKDVLSSTREGFDKNKRPDAILKSFENTDDIIFVYMLKKRKFWPFPIGFRKRFAAGLLPFGVAEHIYKKNLQKVVKVQTREVYLHADKTMTILIDLFVPKKKV